jgi:hypothetical protein
LYFDIDLGVEVRKRTALRAALRALGEFFRKKCVIQQSIKLIIGNFKTCLIYQFLIFTDPGKVLQ